MIKLLIKFDLSLGQNIACFCWGICIHLCLQVLFIKQYEEVSCSNDKDIIPKELKQSICAANKKVKSTETSN